MVDPDPSVQALGQSVEEAPAMRSRYWVVRLVEEDPEVRVATLIGVFAGMFKVGLSCDDVGVVPELDLAAEDLGEGAAVEIDLRASRVGHGVEDTDGSELEGDVEERLAVGG